MGLIVTQPAIEEPVTLAEVKAHCRIDGAAEDALLQAYIAAARARCEGILQRALITREVEQTLDAFPADELQLALLPVGQIVEVGYTDPAGAAQLLAPSAYTLDATQAGSHWLLPAVGTLWPQTRPVINAVRVRYEAGYGLQASDVPPDIRAWLLLTVAYLYAQREAVDATGRAAEIPSRFVDSLLDPYRRYDL